MGRYNMRRFIYIPVIGVAIGEFLMSYDMILEGMGMHIVSTLVIILMIAFGNLSQEVKNILQILILLPLSRIVILSVPRLFTDIYLQYLLICVIMTMPIYSVVKSQYISFEKLETNFERSHIYILIFILIWVAIITVEQYVNIVPNMLNTFSQENISVREEFVSIFLTISLSILLMTLDTKYWNKYVSNTFGMCNNSLLLTFVAIVANKIIMIV